MTNYSRHCGGIRKAGETMASILSKTCFHRARNHSTDRCVRAIGLGVALIGLLASEHRVHAADPVLLENGKSEYQIVVPDVLPTQGMSESLRQTARPVQAAFQANGCDVAVVAEAKRDSARPALFLGDTAYAKAQGVDSSKLSG